MRAASIPCTVDGNRNCESARVTFTAPLRTSAPSSNSACTISSMKNGLPPVRSIISRLSGSSSASLPSSAVSIAAASVAEQRVKSELRQ